MLSFACSIALSCLSVCWDVPDEDFQISHIFPLMLILCSLYLSLASVSLHCLSSGSQASDLNTALELFLNKEHSYHSGGGF